jgi:phenylacetate-CoA ligase
MNFRLQDFIFYPGAIKRFHDMLEDSQYWRPEKRRGWIQEHLDRTLRHAVKNVPYYRKTLKPYEPQFNDMIDSLDLRGLPVITKETIKKHYHELCADNRDQYRPTPIHTSGTTGTPTQFLVDRESNISQFASLWRVLNWAGYHFGNRFVDLRRNPTKSKPLRYDIRLNSLVLAAYDLKKENIPLYVRKLKQFNPVLIKSYPSAIDLFCRWLRETGILSYRPKAVLTCAETLFDHQKAVIDEVLKCPLYDFYNHNERAGLISSCEQGKYHIHEEYSFLELVSNKDSAAKTNNPGKTGSIFATTFHNLAMPLIRYETGDVADFDQNGSCKCNRTYKTIQKILGRVTDVVVTPDGRHLSGLEHAFMNSPGIRLSQIVQETVHGIQVNIVKAETFTDRDIEQVDARLRQFLDDHMEISFNFVDSIAPGKNGKLQFVISRPGRESRGEKTPGEE